MSLRRIAVSIVLLSASVTAVSQTDRSTNLVKLVQEQLFIQGFYSGPINGDPAGSTQAAIARFQLSRSIPAHGSPDQRTLDELGVVRDEPASEGASAPPAENPPAESPDSGKPAQ